MCRHRMPKDTRRVTSEGSTPSIATEYFLVFGERFRDGKESQTLAAFTSLAQH